MVTVAEGVKRIIERSRYLQEALEKELINISSLARYIKPELEEMLIKKTSKSAIIMAVRRVTKKLKPRIAYKNIFKTPPDMIIQSNLVEVTINKSKIPINTYSDLLKLARSRTEGFFTITEGVFETTIIVSRDLYKDIKTLLKKETIVAEFYDLCSITVRLPKEAIFIPGVFYFFLKSLAWEGINIIEVVSAYREFTLILERKGTNKVFSILQALFPQSI
ncbi:MAG: aspartate kinase [Patescibacteria group bacterium]